MSNFVSWIEKEVQGKKKIYFLTGKQVFHTEKGKKLLEQLHGDYIGHSAIQYYYGLPDTTTRGRLYEKECTDFSTPDNFPQVIVRAIKRGVIRGIGIIPELLSQQAWAKYEKIRQQAWAEYKKIEQQAFWDLFAIPENRVAAWR